MIGIILGTLIIACILNAMFFTYKWFAICGKQEKISIGKMLTEGKYKPQYIKPEESRLSTELIKRLNGVVIIIYGSMMLGVVLVIAYQILT